MAMTAGAGGQSDLDVRPRAANGVPLPERDPRDSCDGIGVRVAPANPACAPLSCGCMAQDLTLSVEGAHCVTAIDCDAFCALGEDGVLRLFFCAYPGTCAGDGACMPGFHCVHPAGETTGACVTPAAGGECFADADCESHACVVDSDNGRATCGAATSGARCNVDRHCLSNHCVLPDQEYLGACAGSGAGSPCRSSADCAAGMACVSGLISPGAPRPQGGSLGACSDGIPGSPCRSASDCLDGSVCLASLHQCSVGDVGDACDSAADCSSHLCSSASGRASCTSGEEGAACADVTECKTARCVASACSSGGPGSTCLQDTDCVESACVSEVHQCSDGASGHACDLEHACQAGLSCVGYSCQPS